MAPWDEVMSKFKKGSLKSGGSKKKVTNSKQAIAIMYSEKRKAAGGKAEYKSRRKQNKKGSKLTDIMK